MGVKKKNAVLLAAGWELAALTLAGCAASSSSSASSSPGSSDGGCATCGVRQICTGSGSAAKCTCQADPVCTVAGTLCTSNSAYASCAQDEQGCVYEALSTPCSGTTPACLTGGCVACAPGQTTCSGTTTPQVCDATGQWQSRPACTGETPYCSQGSCTVPPPPPPSCQVSAAGTTGCGAASESCCTSLGVPGGTYDRTYTNGGGGATGLADPATVSSFRLDKYDVTVGRFRQFVSAWNNGAGFTPAAGSGKHTHLNGGQGLADSASAGAFETGWVATDTVNLAPNDANLACDPSYATWTSVAGNHETLPINCANWWESYAFCTWDGGFLPSEAEWEYAAAGGSQEREYPWGATDPGTANQYAIYGCYYPSGTVDCTDASNIAAVGTAASGAGLWGQLDLAGNVWQWNLDWSAPYSACTDCAYLTGATSRVLRGGNFSVYGGTSYLLPPVRNDDSPSDRSYDSGFRCARTP